MHTVRNEEISEAHMFLMLPTKTGRDAFEDLERKLPSLNFEEIFEKMEVVFGDILLPRMEMEFTANLGPFLSGIGEKSHKNYCAFSMLSFGIVQMY